MKKNIWGKLIAGVAAAFVFAGVSAFAQTVTIILPNGVSVVLTGEQASAARAAANSGANVATLLVSSQAFAAGTPQVKAALAAYTSFLLPPGAKSLAGTIAVAVVNSVVGVTDKQAVAQAVASTPGVSKAAVANALAIAGAGGPVVSAAATAAVQLTTTTTTIGTTTTTTATTTPGATTTTIVVEQGNNSGTSAF